MAFTDYYNRKDTTIQISKLKARRNVKNMNERFTYSLLIFVIFFILLTFTVDPDFQSLNLDQVRDPNLKEKELFCSISIFLVAAS